MTSTKVVTYEYAPASLDGNVTDALERFAKEQGKLGLERVEVHLNASIPSEYEPVHGAVFRYDQNTPIRFVDPFHQHWCGQVMAGRVTDATPIEGKTEEDLAGIFKHVVPDRAPLGRAPTPGAFDSIMNASDARPWTEELGNEGYIGLYRELRPHSSVPDGDYWLVVGIRAPSDMAHEFYSGITDAIVRDAPITFGSLVDSNAYQTMRDVSRRMCGRIFYKAACALGVERNIEGARPQVDSRAVTRAEYVAKPLVLTPPIANEYNVLRRGGENGEKVFYYSYTVPQSTKRGAYVFHFLPEEGLWIHPTPDDPSRSGGFPLGISRKFNFSHDRDVIRRLSGRDVVVDGTVLKPIALYRSDPGTPV